MKKSYSSSIRGVLVMCVMIFAASVSYAQNKITGKISDQSGNGLPGVSVVVKGTKVGSSSDANGNYAVNAEANSTLVFSSIGFKNREVSVGNQSSINISMEDDAAALSEVVVTGYQSVRKKDITGAVTVVEMKGMKGMQSSSFVQNLAGRAPGVTISTSGSPGDATNIRVRGISSFTQNDPLFIIDGIPSQGDKYQNQINPEDIESMQVLKDAAASSIYGSRASNGVIIITTKSGKAGKTKLSYSGSYGIANPVKGYDDVLSTDSKEFREAIKRKLGPDAPSWATDANFPKYINPTTNGDPGAYNEFNNQISETNTVGTNWWQAMTRPGAINQHSLNVSGGSEAATFSITGGYLKQEGVLIFNNFNRASLRANSAFKVGKSLRFGENLAVSSTWGSGVGSISGNNNEQSIFGDLLKANPIIPIYDIKGGPGSNLNVNGVAQNFNPVARLTNNKDNNNSYFKILGSFFGEAQIFKGFSVRSQVGVDVTNGNNRTFNNTAFWKKEPITTNNFQERWEKYFTLSFTNTATYSKVLAEKHAVTVLVGQEAIKGTNRAIGGGVADYFTTDVNAWYLNTGFGNPGSRSVYSDGGAANLASYFGKVDYAFNDKYLLSATIRRDGSSKFLSDVRYGIFPAVSVGWRLSEESFMKDLTWLSDLKLRASYGEIGNQLIGNYSFADIYGSERIGQTFYAIDGSNTTPATGYALRNRGNAAVKWETSKTANIGFDAGLLDNTLNIVLDVYNRKTDDLLFNPPLPGTAGAASAPNTNVGSMVNKGFDLGVNYRKNLNKDLSFNVGLNLSQFKNEIVKIADDVNDFQSPGNLTERFPGQQVFINRLKNPISSFQGYVTDGLIKTEAERAKQVGAQIGGFKFKDLNNDGTINSDDQTIIGSPFPNFTSGLNLGVNYKGFDVTAFLFGSFGNDIFNATKIQSVFMNFNSNVLKGLVANDGINGYPKINGLDASSRNASNFFVEDGSYVRLSNMQLGYNLPRTLASKLGMGNTRIYLQGQNLFTITKYSGVDPAVSNANIGNSGQSNDLSSGYDNGNYPSNKIVSIGVNLEF